MICGGLLGRYLLEFGEMSNTYNFTPANAAFHMLLLASAATASWKLKAVSSQSGGSPER